MPAPPYLGFKRTALSHPREERRRNDERERELQLQLQRQRECTRSITYYLQQYGLRPYGTQYFLGLSNDEVRRLGAGQKSLLYLDTLVQNPGQMLECVVKVRSRGVENAAIRSDIGCSRLMLYFKREAKIWSKLREANHPNILPIWGYVPNFDSSLFPGVISPYYSNGTMYSYIRNWSGKFPTPKKLKFLCDLLNGLAYVHGQHIVHRDLKAENVLIDDNEVALLGDFGNSKFLVSVDEIPSSDPAPDDWTPPEYIGHSQLAYHSPTTEGDMWSFGCTFIEVIRQQYPCSPEKHPANKILSGELPCQNPGVGRTVDDPYWSVISACLNKGHPPTGRISAHTALQLLQMLLKIKNLSDKAKDLERINPRESRKFETESKRLQSKLYHAVATERARANGPKQKFVANLKRIGQLFYRY